MAKSSSKNLKQAVAELEEKWKRALADYQNLEKRIDRDRQKLVKFANGQLIEKLLHILDELDRAQQHLNDKGLTMIINQFRSILNDEGVEEIKIKPGDRFDPERMDCVDLVKGKKNTVVEIQTKGYTLHDRVLRPAQVKIGSAQS